VAGAAVAAAVAAGSRQHRPLHVHGQRCLDHRHARPPREEAHAGRVLGLVGAHGRVQVAGRAREERERLRDELQRVQRQRPLRQRPPPDARPRLRHRGVRQPRRQVRGRWGPARCDREVLRRLDHERDDLLVVGLERHIGAQKKVPRGFWTSAGGDGKGGRVCWVRVGSGISVWDGEAGDAGTG